MSGPMKIGNEMISEEWDDEDGYWIALRPRWKSALDPVGAEHTVHGDTRGECLAVGVLRCDCAECRRDMSVLQGR